MKNKSSRSVANEITIGNIKNDNIVVKNIVYCYTRKMIFKMEKQTTKGYTRSNEHVAAFRELQIPVIIDPVKPTIAWFERPAFLALLADIEPDGTLVLVTFADIIWTLEELRSFVEEMTQHRGLTIRVLKNTITLDRKEGAAFCASIGLIGSIANELKAAYRKDGAKHKDKDAKPRKEWQKDSQLEKISKEVKKLIEKYPVAQAAEILGVNRLTLYNYMGKKGWKPMKRKKKGKD